MMILRQTGVYVRDHFAGMIQETDEGYCFSYDPEYLKSEKACSVSLTLPLRAEPYKSHTLLPFFDGLIPEGWLLDIAEETWKLNPRDRFGLLLACCRSSIGAVSVREVKDGEE